ncbi:TPA: hypothetical protein ACHVGO_002017, partial [Streptococcus suis]
IFLSLKKYKNFFAYINEKKYGMACELTELNGNFLICYRFQYIIKKRKRLRCASGLDRRTYESKTEWCADAHFIITWEIWNWFHGPIGL